MLASIRDRKGQGNAGLYARIRSGTGKFWDFTTLAWRDTDTTPARSFLTEYPDADVFESRYQTSLPLPFNADVVVEYVRAADAFVIAEDAVPFNTELTAIRAKTDNLPPDPASNSYFDAVADRIRPGANLPAADLPAVVTTVVGTEATFKVSQPVGLVQGFYVTLLYIDGGQFWDETTQGLVNAGGNTHIPLTETNVANEWSVTRDLAGLPDGNYLISAFNSGNVSVAVAGRLIITAGVPMPINQIALTEHTGGTDNLAYVTSDGQPIVGASVRVYTNADWTAKQLNNPVGATTTNARGRWVSPIFCNPGTYAVVFQLAGSYGPDAVIVTV